MESYQYLTENIPQWIDKLDLLSQNVTERRIEFNRLSQSSGSLTPSIGKKKTGSTESLRPVELDDGNEIAAVTPDASMPPPPTPNTPPVNVDINPNSKRLFQEYRNQIRRKRKSASLLSGTSGQQKFRSRMSLIVYYDSNIQQGFEWLVRGVASARNNLRKGKMTASYKSRMASLNVEESPFDAERTDLPIRNPNVPRFQRSSAPFSVDALSLEQFDVIDKDLETAQTLCEVGAHQFLRDANCNDELVAIKERFENSLKIVREQFEILKTEEEEKKLEQIQWSSIKQPAQMGGIEIDDLASDTRNDYSNPMAIEIDDSNRVEVDPGAEIGNQAPNDSSGGGLGSGMIEIDDSIETNHELPVDLATFRKTKYSRRAETGDSAPTASNRGPGKDMPEIDDSAPTTSKRWESNGGGIEIDDTPAPANGAGLGAGMIEIDDNNEDNNEFNMDLSSFRRTRR